MTDDLISREAAIAMIVADKDLRFKSAQLLVDAIRALPAVQPQVTVKLLKWVRGRAATPFGDYYVYNDSPGMWCVNFEASHMVLEGVRVQPTEAAARQAAQADYDARITAALDPAWLAALEAQVKAADGLAALVADEEMPDWMVGEGRANEINTHDWLGIRKALATYRAAKEASHE